MARKVCSVDGCEGLVHSHGMCWKHERSELGLDPKTGKPLADSAPKKPGPKPVDRALDRAAVLAKGKKIIQDRIKEKLAKNSIVTKVTDPVPVVSEDEIRSTDYVAFLRELMHEKLEYFVSELNAAKTPKQRAQFYISMCDAVEQLGY